MTQPTPHDPNCAIVRTGDIRAWCDCGTDEPITERLQAFYRGKLSERERILKRLRYGVKEFRSLSRTDPKWWLVAEILEEEADVIESGDYWNDKDSD